MTTDTSGNPILPAAQRDHPDDRFVTLVDGLRLCYRDYGDPAGKPVLLVAGLSMQLHCWPTAMVDGLVEQGFRVIAPDNRDCGRSSRTDAGTPNRLRQLVAWPTTDNYSLDDMADDLARLVIALKLGHVHAIGMSMGGMIAQTLAARRPDLTASLVSIFSSTGNPLVGRPAASTLQLMARPGLPLNADQAAARFVTMMRHIGDASAPGSIEEWTAYAKLAWARNGGRPETAGMARQVSAAQKSGNRTAMLRRVEAPTLVVHGDVDLIVHPSGGKATAQAIPGARLQIIEGMRHHMDSRNMPTLLGYLIEHMQQASLASSPVAAST